jgi:hypothetical protein
MERFHPGLKIQPRFNDKSQQNPARYYMALISARAEILSM